MTPSNKRKPLSHEQENKGSGDKATQILTGAMHQFLIHGYAGTSMDKVAATAGVSKQTLYSYFQDKENLFTALVERMARERFQVLFGDKPLEGEPSIVLRQVATRALSTIANDQKYLAFVRLAIAESGRFPHLAQLMIRNGFQPGIHQLSCYFAKHPELKISNPEATARIFTGSLMSFILTMEMLHGKEIMPMESDRFIDSLIDLVLCRSESSF